MMAESSTPDTFDRSQPPALLQDKTDGGIFKTAKKCAPRRSSSLQKILSTLSTERNKKTPTGNDDAW